MKTYLFLIILFLVYEAGDAQNESKLIIDASPDQTNMNPLIKLRSFTATDIMGITSGNPSNTFIGVRAGEDNMTGGGNTGFGYVALANVKGGSNNTGLGAFVTANNPEGNQITAIGSGALTQTHASSVNTSVGSNAGYLRDYGWNNVLVGANTEANQHDLFNIIAVGQGTLVTGSSTARFGNSATGSYGGWANWTNVSDGRYKKNVRSNVPGLEFILRLKPVTYQLDFTSINCILDENKVTDCSASLKNAIEEKERVVQSGFIAQEVERVAEELNYSFSGVDCPKNSNDYYGIRYAEFVVPLIKSVQELNQALINQQVNLIAEQKSLCNRLSEIESLMRMND